MAEKDTIALRAIILTAIATFVITASGLEVVRWSFQGLEAERKARDPAPSPMAPQVHAPKPIPAPGPDDTELPVPKTTPGPVLQVSPVGDMEAMRRREAVLLKTYGWVDRPNGVIRLRIERAIELTAERKLPARREGER